MSGSSRLSLGIPDQSWGPAPAPLGEHLAEAGITWDCPGTHSTSIPGERPAVSGTSRTDFLRELPASSRSIRPRLRASGRSLIGYGAVRLRLGRPVSVRVDKDVLFTLVMTFFHASIEMGRPPPLSECLPWVFPGRSRRGFPQDLLVMGFPRIFTAWVSPGSPRHGFPQDLHGVGFPRVFTSWVSPGSSRRVGAALLFPFPPSRHGMACSSLGLRSSAPLSRARVRGSGSRGNALV